MAKKKQTGIRHCKRCGEIISLEKRSHAIFCTALCGTLYRNAIWQKANPEKMKAAIKAWGVRHPEKMREKARRAARTKKDREHAAIPIRDCIECGEQVLHRNRRMKSKWCSVLCQSRWQAKDWMRQNPGKARERSRRYTARKLEAAPSWLTIEHKTEMALMYDRAIKSRLNVDHIIPLQGKGVCGLHVPWNLQLLTASENREKSNSYAS